MNDPSFFGQFMFAMIALGTFLNILLSIMRGRTPPIAEEMAKTYATKRELAELDARISARYDSLETKIDRLVAATSANHGDIVRELGELRGEFKKCPYLCAASQNRSNP